MAPKFCCCLPLRLGTLVITFIQFLLCGAVAGGSWYLLKLSKDDGLSLQTNVRTALIVAGAIYTFAAIIGLFGFLGASFKKNGLVKTYLALLYLTLILSIASGIYSLVMFYRFRDRAGAHKDCVDDSTSGSGINYCDALQNFGNAPTWAIWVSSIVPIVILSYACYVVHNYTRRLAKQKVDRENVATRSLATGTKYSAVKNEEAHPLTQPTYTYPYSDAPNSFSNTTSPPTTGHAASYYNDNKV